MSADGTRVDLANHTATIEVTCAAPSVRVPTEAAANRALKAEREKTLSTVHDRLIRSYGSSRLAQPLIDRAHRLLESSNKRNPLKRSFKATGDHYDDSTGLAVSCKRSSQSLPQKPPQLPPLPTFPTKEDLLRNPMFQSLPPPHPTIFDVKPPPPSASLDLRFSFPSQPTPPSFSMPSLLSRTPPKPPPPVSTMSSLIGALAASLGVNTTAVSPQMNIAQDLSLNSRDETPPPPPPKKPTNNTSILSVERLLSGTHLPASSPDKRQESQASPSSTSSASSAAISPKLTTQQPPMPVPLTSSFDTASVLFKNLLAVASGSSSPQPPMPHRGFIPPPPLTWMKLLHNGGGLHRPPEGAPAGNGAALMMSRLFGGGGGAGF
ncbi:unnamed protein product [Mesocestoides corti]|uniref:Uncharacterized protein n=2 Tax=Mesocestoides corti TaxID=53468 RepID=A0A0R3UE28_MESCO|nr:unnamed protein product [Mesocestoides corti]